MDKKCIFLISLAFANAIGGGGVWTGLEIWLPLHCDLYFQTDFLKAVLLFLLFCSETRHFDRYGQSDDRKSGSCPWAPICSRQTRLCCHFRTGNGGFRSSLAIPLSHKATKKHLAYLFFKGLCEVMHAFFWNSLEMTICRCFSVTLNRCTVGTIKIMPQSDNAEVDCSHWFCGNQ